MGTPLPFTLLVGTQIHLTTLLNHQSATVNCAIVLGPRGKDGPVSSTFPTLPRSLAHASSSSPSPHLPLLCIVCVGGGGGGFRGEPWTLLVVRRCKNLVYPPNKSKSKKMHALSASGLSDLNTYKSNYRALYMGPGCSDKKTGNLSCTFVPCC